MNKLIESIILLSEPPNDPFCGCALRITDDQLSKACVSKYAEYNHANDYIPCRNCVFHYSTYKLITLTFKENIQNV